MTDFICPSSSSFRNFSFGEDDLVLAQPGFLFEFCGQRKALGKGDLIVALTLVKSDPVIARTEFQFRILESAGPLDA